MNINLYEILGTIACSATSSFLVGLLFGTAIGLHSGLKKRIESAGLRIVEDE